MSNKPGGSMVPEAYQKEVYKLCNKALELCFNANYTELSDFVERAAVFTKKLEAKKAELPGIEEAEKQKRMGLCYRRAPTDNSSGGYAIGSRAGKDALDPSEFRALPTTAADAAAGVARTPLAAAEVAARCADDPEALFLSGRGLLDGDVGVLCEGLHRAGAQLTTLDLSHNRIADAGVQRLATALASGVCPRLAELWLDGNPVGELGAQVLTGGLRTLRRGLVVHGVGAAAVDEGGDTGDVVCSAQVASPQELAPSPAEEAPAASGGGTPPAPVPAPSPCQGTRVELVPASSCQGEGESVRVILPLPEGVEAASDLDLHVSAMAFAARSRHDGSLVAEGALPLAVDPDSTRASLSRRRRELTLLMRCAEPVRNGALQKTS